MSEAESKETKIAKLKNSNRKHEEDIRRWQKAIQDSSRIVSDNNGKLKLLEAEGEFYVYVVYVDGFPRYVGKGKKDRYKHAVSGSSSCPELNRDFFQGKYIEVLFVERYMTEKKALAKELDWIGQISSCYDEGTADVYNKNVPVKFNYYDECMEYFYHHWFTHACDNSKQGVKRVIPAYTDGGFGNDS